MSFSFREKRPQNQPGFHKLIVTIHEDEEESFYHIERVDLRVTSHAQIGGENETIDLSITSAWGHDDRYHVIPGSIILTSSEMGKIEVFTFGGEIEIEKQAQEVRCSVSSEAPLYKRSNEQTLIEEFIEEVEILLSQQHSRWGDKDFEYYLRLAKTPPLDLYTACLKALLDKLHSPGYDHISDSGQIKRLLERELDLLNETEVPSLSTILDPVKT